MSPEVAVEKMRALWELGLADVTVRGDLWDAFHEYILTQSRLITTPSVEPPRDKVLLFKSLIARRGN